VTGHGPDLPPNHGNHAHRDVRYGLADGEEHPEEELIPEPVPGADRQPFMLHREVPGASGAAMRGHRRARAGGPAWWLSLPWFEPWHQGQHRWSEDYARKAAGREERSLAGGVHAAGRRSRLRRCSEGQP
jgi:hypothetical protein